MNPLAHEPHPHHVHFRGEVTVVGGSSPLILSFPHVGTFLPPEVSVCLNDIGRAVPDTDWCLDNMYFRIAEHMSATKLIAGLSRYVIDLNRDPSGQSLYPGTNTTVLCPTTTFENQRIYNSGMEPDEGIIEYRRRNYFEPYHAALRAEIIRLKELHGYCVLFDCHSIRSSIPYLFEGTLPTFNLGTNDSKSCAPEIERAACEATAVSGETWVLNGRFKGGWITRNYGDPTNGVHAFQLELAQSAYMEEAPPWRSGGQNSLRTQAHLELIVNAIMGAAAKVEGTKSK